jgi:ribonucleotide reductase beta subunit family protein with ferritin-like domain
MSEPAFIEPLLTPDDNRYVMFPIKHNDVWDMYKRAIDSFWIVNEVNLAQDLKDWNGLNEDERNFIKMVLAFFAASDGVVTENLAVRFMNDVQIAEVRAFYGFQIAIENIHCVTGNTKIMTDNGYYNIEDLEDKKVNIWNGKEFTEVEVKYTGDQSIYKVTLSNGMELDCTSGHKWLIRTGNQSHPENCKTERIETKDLSEGAVITKYELPVIKDIVDPNDFLNPYMHGFFCGDGTYCNKYPMIYLYGEKKNLLENFKYNTKSERNNAIQFYITEYINKPKFEVPINYSIDTKLRWLEGYADADGCINLNNTKDATSIQINSINKQFLKDIQLMLTTLGINSNIKLQKKACKRLLPKNDGSGESAYYNCKDCYVMYISCKSVNKLIELGFSPKRIKILYCERLNKRFDVSSLIKVKTIEKISDNEKTYCFNEPKEHTGIFNGILTGQSETYSLLIDTYIKDDNEKMKLFEATTNYPCIAKKFNWAKKWLDDKRSSFAKRLVAFAIIEGIFFSSSFACIYWIKKRGLMPGLTFSNELISRDEALHTEFAVLLYSKIVKKLPKKKIVEIIQEAVEIEKEFITEAIPCRMIGMNAKLMKQYIEFVADRLSLQLGYDKIYNSSNPFDFMELISVESKVNFFERTNSEYALANKSIDKDIFEFNAEF